MNRDRMIRFAAVLVGGAVIFGLQQGASAKLYFAIPGGIIAYIITLVALGVVFGSQAK
ncbi:MAG: hypothetical protein WA406_05610 [Pseudolabrys sp.]